MIMVLQNFLSLVNHRSFFFFSLFVKASVPRSVIHPHTLASQVARCIRARIFRTDILASAYLQWKFQCYHFQNSHFHTRIFSMYILTKVLLRRAFQHCHFYGQHFSVRTFTAEIFSVRIFTKDIVAISFFSQSFYCSCFYDGACNFTMAISTPTFCLQTIFQSESNQNILLRFIVCARFDQSYLKVLVNGPVFFSCYCVTLLFDLMTCDI